MATVDDNIATPPVLTGVGAYYNEFDPKAAAWLRELIKMGHIADGEVDERSILDVRHTELRGFTQCHFFAGIGGWSLALRLAGWSDDEPVWTGSPPCQPFSPAGKGLSRDDPRHLAPHFIDLVRGGRPAVLFGEQVASAAVFGKAAKRARGSVAGAPEWAWIDDLSDRLEAARYAVGASDIPAAGIGAPHIRQRTFFGAVDVEGLDHTTGTRHISEGQGAEGQTRDETRLCGPERGRPSSRLADADDAGPQGRGGMPERADQCAAGPASVDDPDGPAHAPHDPWGTVDWLFCRDGKWRPVEAGTFPLVDGLPRGVGRGGDDGRPFHPAEARVMRLKGYGNAIVPQAAAEFIRAFRDAIDDTSSRP